jgi:hypothetical protein
MMQNQYDIYAQFLVRCRQVMGPFDVERLEYDEAYKAEFFNRIALSADDRLFELADMVSRVIEEEITSLH